MKPGAQSNPHDDNPDQSDQKASQEASGYMGPENGPFECEHCLHFSEPHACEIVSGDIDPEGCCNLFSPDPNRRPDDEGEENEEPDEAGGPNNDSGLPDENVPTH